ncbi:hypothetical protein BN1058_02117 [Paraliobacillus sp. PM-2]|uniref:DUF881 domain-containing protein n=1 Tax=Paraliobacillus sp. PM-2 TaxID=1462524 RepID=UPI00061C465E|nr:DUF881 domain-containing protein [Paraliobacillus sp. PM-2]CQR47787.1 hypothetical protein BN1058_02117 [Paraliobacillus sp. PM-2]
MSLKSKIIVSILCIFIGFMIAIQFQTTSSSKQRETRDLWEVRAQLQEEQQQQQLLYQQLDKLEVVLEEYQDQSEQEQVAALQNSIQELKKKAGLVEKTSDGVKITIDGIFIDSPYAQEYPTVSPELLNRLLNELNTYGAKDIAIENERIVTTSPIRYVNGETYVNNHALPDLPIEVYVLSDNPQRLMDYMEVSQSKDDFSIENMSMQFTLIEEMTLPAYQERINFDLVEVNEETGEE